MPFFNFRRIGSSISSSAALPAQNDSVEVIRKRAKHRLIGAAVLVLAGVVGFPILFDTQPRPIAIDIAIEIPGKNAVKPLVAPTKQGASAVRSIDSSVAAASPVSPASPAASAASAAPEKVTAASSLSSKEEIFIEKKPPAIVLPTQVAIKNEAKSALTAELRPEAQSNAKPAVKPAVPVNDGARAQALLNGQTAAPAVAVSATTLDTASLENRMIVQVGAFADAAKAREVRLRLEKAGLKTYTQVVETKDGKRFRVRVGTFATKAEAEKASSKIKTLDLPASILTL